MLQTLLQTLGLFEAGDLWGVIVFVYKRWVLQTLGLSEAGDLWGVIVFVHKRWHLQTLGLSEAGHIVGCDRVCLQTLVATNVGPLRGRAYRGV